MSTHDGVSKSNLKKVVARPYGGWQQPLRCKTSNSGCGSTTARKARGTITERPIEERLAFHLVFHMKSTTSTCSHDRTATPPRDNRHRQHHCHHHQRHLPQRQKKSTKVGTCSPQAERANHAEQEEQAPNTHHTLILALSPNPVTLMLKMVFSAAAAGAPPPPPPPDSPPPSLPP